MYPHICVCVYMQENLEKFTHKFTNVLCGWRNYGWLFSFLLLCFEIFIIQTCVAYVNINLKMLKTMYNWMRVLIIYPIYLKVAQPWSKNGKYKNTKTSDMWEFCCLFEKSNKIIGISEVKSLLTSWTLIIYFPRYVTIFKCYRINFFLEKI